MTPVPFDDRDGSIWLDGHLLPWRDVRLHVLSHGLHYASSVFEGERAYGGTIFRLRDHTNRLLHSAHVLGIALPWTVDQIDAACQAVLTANGLTDAYLRPVAWLGAEAMGVSPTGARGHLAIAAWSWDRYYDQGRMEGVRLAQSRWRRPAPDTAPTMAKCSALYAIGGLAKRAAEAEGCADALMLDWRGLVSETTSANVFLVIDGALHTPTPDCFLDGITRRTVMRLAARRQMKVIERPIEACELTRVTEAFLAGTAAEVTAVRELAGRRLVPGPITETLIRDYAALVREPAETVAALVG